MKCPISYYVTGLTEGFEIVRGICCLFFVVVVVVVVVDSVVCFVNTYPMDSAIQPTNNQGLVFSHAAKQSFDVFHQTRHQKRHLVCRGGHAVTKTDVPLCFSAGAYPL